VALNLGFLDYDSLRAKELKAQMNKDLGFEIQEPTDFSLGVCR